MNLSEFEAEFSQLGSNYKTKDVDRFNRTLIKRQEDVSFLKDIVLSKQEYHRTYFQVSLAEKKGIEEKFAFIEENFDKLQDWWHVDQLSQFVDKELTFDFGYEKAKVYVQSELPFARRWGYVLFMPSLVKEVCAAEKIFPLFKDDDEYYVQMAEAWLISYLGIYEPEKGFKRFVIPSESAGIGKSVLKKFAKTISKENMCKQSEIEQKTNAYGWI